jgi:hypothetical protein
MRGNICLGEPPPWAIAATAPKSTLEETALAQRVADLFALVAIGHRGHSIAADRIADVERAEADVAAVVPEHHFVIDDGSETRIHDHKRLGGGIREIEGVPPWG